MDPTGKVAKIATLNTEQKGVVVFRRVKVDVRGKLKVKLKMNPDLIFTGDVNPQGSSNWISVHFLRQLGVVRVRVGRLFKKQWNALNKFIVHGNVWEDEPGNGKRPKWDGLRDLVMEDGAPHIKVHLWEVPQAKNVLEPDVKIKTTRTFLDGSYYFYVDKKDKEKGKPRQRYRVSVEPLLQLYDFTMKDAPNKKNLNDDKDSDVSQAGYSARFVQADIVEIDAGIIRTFLLQGVVWEDTFPYDGVRESSESGRIRDVGVFYRYFDATGKVLGEFEARKK